MENAVIPSIQYLQSDPFDVLGNTCPLQLGLGAAVMRCRSAAVLRSEGWCTLRDTGVRS